MRFAIRWKLFVYNYFKLPFNEWNFKRRYLREWIAEGRDPARFPRFGKIGLDDYDWALNAARNRDPNAKSRPYAEMREELKMQGDYILDKVSRKP